MGNIILSVENEEKLYAIAATQNAGKKCYTREEMKKFAHKVGCKVDFMIDFETILRYLIVIIFNRSYF